MQMPAPDERLFDADLADAEFRAGEIKGFWGLAVDSERPPDAAWPKVYVWVAAASRGNAPDRFYLALDASDYRSVPPTGTFWDAVKKDALPLADYPKGSPNSRVAKVFRSDNWMTTYKALYHPYDRVSLRSHPNWRTEQPHLVWDSNHTIVDYLNEMRKLLTCGDYVGV
jgi:hypothetical protein